MAHTEREQQFLLARDRIRDGALPFLKTTFDGDGWLEIYNGNETYLLMACYYRQSSVIDYLLSRAAENISLPSVQKWLKIVAFTDNNPLHNYICAASNVYRRKPRVDGLPILTSVVRKLVKLGFDVNSSNSYGETPLFLAAVSNDMITLETLIEIGADVNVGCCVLQETVLHQACLSAHNTLLDTLLSVEGIDIDMVNANGWTPLHLAASRGDVYKVKSLLLVGANATIESDRGDTALFFSLQARSDKTAHTAFEVIFDYINKTKKPEEATAHFLHINKRDETLLDCAIRHQNFRGMKTLLEHGDLFDIKQRDREGRSLLHLSIVHAPNQDIIVYLLEHGLSPNDTDNKGNTPLIYFFKQPRIIPHLPVEPPHPNFNI